MPGPLRFFFYGTLIAGSGNAAARAAHARLRPLGAASVAGALWAIPDAAGWYPALVRARGGRVHGGLYEAVDGFGPDDLARLDAWEDYRPAERAQSLYLREDIRVRLASGACVPAQLYRFNQPLPPEARAIAHGDFQAWLKDGGFAAYTG